MMKRFAWFPLIAVAVGPSASDLFYPRQWGLHNTGERIIEITRDYGHTDKITAVKDVDIGWEQAQGAVARLAKTPVIVAVIDSGIDADHEDLIGRIVEGGKNFLSARPEESGNVTDDVGHGTHLSGIIAANAGNKLGIAGVAPATVKILPLKVLSGQKTEISIAEASAKAIRYALEKGAGVINMSLSWPRAYDSPDARSAVRDAVNKGVIIVASAGNDRKKEPTYPCSYDGVVCVGAVSIDGSMSVYSDYGSHVDLLGPGDDVVSTYPTARVSSGLRFQKYETLSGTSQAAPHLAAIAATIKSAYPTISSQEVKARLFASSSAIPREGAALYGLAHLDLALQPVTTPVFYPHFKTLTPALVDESTLQVTGKLVIENFGMDSKATKIFAKINGKPAGALSLAAFARGALQELTWSYAFASLDESADLELTLEITDASGLRKCFSSHIETARSIDRIATASRVRIDQKSAGVNLDEWFEIKRGVPVLALTPILDYGKPQSSSTLYFQSLDPNSGKIAIIDTTRADGVRQVEIPFVYGVGQILRLDANFDGKLDYVALGFGTFPDGGTFLQFTFVDADFKPLWPEKSAWQIPVTSKNSILLHSYSTPGSWIKRDGRLMPAMIASGTLPEPDNYNLSLARFQNAKHLYFLEPDGTIKFDNKHIQALRLRAVDSASLRRSAEDAFNIEAFAPMTADELARGELRVIISSGRGLNAAIRFLTATEAQVRLDAPPPGWDMTSFGGKTLDVIPTGAMAYVHFLDIDRGQVDWFTRDRTMLARTSFKHSELLDSIANAVGAFDFGGRGKIFLADTHYGFVGVHTKAGQSKQASFELERDAAYDAVELNAMYTPVLVGPRTQPRAAVYIDSTSIRGERVTIAVYDDDRDVLERTLRYSYHVPSNCIALKPTADSQNNYALTLLCQGVDDAEFKSVQLDR